jgi:hypothetical protein
MFFLKKIISYISLKLREKLIQCELNIADLKNRRNALYLNNDKNLNNDKKEKINIFIDLNFFRSTYDIIGQLIYSQMYAKQNNLDCNLIIINDTNSPSVAKINNKKETKFINDATVLRHNGITLPIIHCVKDFNPNIYIFNNAQEAKFFYNSKDFFKIPSYASTNEILKWDDYYIKINNIYKETKLIAYLKAPNYAKEFLNYYLDFNKIINTKGIVTLTLRNSSYTEVRNSDIESWKKFYQWLEKHNYFPIFINDIEDLKFQKKLLHGFNFIELATYNLHIRLALYEAAIINCGTSCGPTLCLNFSENPYLLFKTYVDYNCSASLESFEKINGFKFTQWPFAKKNQKLVWDTSDGIDLIINEFNKYVSENN